MVSVLGELRARSCDLVTDAGEVVAGRCGAGSGTGPLNVVLAQRPGVGLPAGARVYGHRGGGERRPIPDGRLAGPGLAGYRKSD